MEGRRLLVATLTMLTVVSGGLPVTVAAGDWAGQTFLPDYDELQLVEGREGRDYLYLREVDPERMACRLGNSHVTADRRIDCHDRKARQQRPRLLGQ